VRQSIDPSHGIDDDFGNFKGYAGWPDSDVMESAGRSPGVVAREVATIKARSGSAAIQFEFETWEASMLPIYAARYWYVKHPAIDKLMTQAQIEEYRKKKANQSPDRTRLDAAENSGGAPRT
jgi:hypothetical protein